MGLRAGGDASLQGGAGLSSILGGPQEPFSQFPLFIYSVSPFQKHCNKGLKCGGGGGERGWVLAYRRDGMTQIVIFFFLKN